jgi:hypothetical protein
MTPIIAALAPVLGTLVDRLVPDAHEREKARAAVEAELIRAATAANAAQTDINAKEAESQSLFVAGWRPAVGWACAAGFAWTYLGHPIATWTLTVAGVETALPPIDTAPLTEMLLALLGMAGLRSFEKLRGVAR